MKNDAGAMSMSEEAKQNAWAEHYERLRDIEIDWDPDHLSNELLLEGHPITITIDMVKKAISKMKSGKAAGPSGIVVEMITRLAIDWSICILTRPVVNTGFNRSLLVDWWSIEKKHG